ncbi:Hypothetical protein CINCED_3A022527 [Cinara cedri]|uniref:Uncharacterized protein n=1 Tax=Cinara cedri TaxID=506608 RepID=A0A5E4MKW6_9HEMI|nr:Hypothetical protein CINCED_3A022527 [Cinara cedri]
MFSAYTFDTITCDIAFGVWTRFSRFRVLSSQDIDLSAGSCFVHIALGSVDVPASCIRKTSLKITLLHVIRTELRVPVSVHWALRRVSGVGDGRPQSGYYAAMTSGCTTAGAETTTAGSVTAEIGQVAGDTCSRTFT